MKNIFLGDGGLEGDVTTEILWLEDSDNNNTIPSDSGLRKKLHCTYKQKISQNEVNLPNM
jgi:hypothetical protein